MRLPLLFDADLVTFLDRAYSAASIAAPGVAVHERIANLRRALHEQYHANRASRKKYGKGPSREMIAAYEQRNSAKPRAKGGAAAGRNQEGQRRPGRVQ